MALQNQITERLHYLDAVRGCALLLGIVFHASISFLPIYIGWAVMDVSTSDIVGIFMLVSHSFRMEVFFLIAGFFSHMKLHQTGAVAWVQSRLMRIAIPFLILWFVLRPLLVSGWVMGMESLRGDVDILAGLQAGFESLNELPSNLLLGTHLWFLYYLLLLSLTVLIIRSTINLHQPTYSRLSCITDRVTTWVSTSRLATFVIPLPIALCLWFMHNWGVDTPDKSLAPHVPVTFLYGGFFSLGWLMHRQVCSLESFARFSWHKLILCFLAITTTVVLSGYEMQSAHQHYAILKATYCVSYALMMWTMVSLFICVCRKLFSKPGAKMKYIADASYWLYLIHLPIVVWLQIAFAELAMPWYVKLPAIVAITLVISLALYDGLVRSSFLGRILNGKSMPRRLFSRFNEVQFGKT